MLWETSTAKALLIYTLGQAREFNSGDTQVSEILVATGHSFQHKVLVKLYFEIALLRRIDVLFCNQVRKLIRVLGSREAYTVEVKDVTLEAFIEGIEEKDPVLRLDPPQLRHVNMYLGKCRPFRPHCADRFRDPR